MSLKRELEIWSKALEAFDSHYLEAALEQFELIAETSRIWFNLAIIKCMQGDHKAAIWKFKSACELDPFLAIGHMQAGISFFLTGRYKEALKAFEGAYVSMRDCEFINYKQLGLNYVLYICEILFNRGLTLVHMDRMDEGLQLILQASYMKRLGSHGVIDTALKSRAAGCTVFRGAAGIIFRPPAAKLKNLAQRDYLGSATVIADHNYSQSRSMENDMEVMDLHSNPNHFQQQHNRSQSSPQNMSVDTFSSSPTRVPQRKPTLPLLNLTRNASVSSVLSPWRSSPTQQSAPASRVSSTSSNSDTSPLQNSTRRGNVDQRPRMPERKGSLDARMPPPAPYRDPYAAPFETASPLSHSLPFPTSMSSPALSQGATNSSSSSMISTPPVSTQYLIPPPHAYHRKASAPSPLTTPSLVPLPPSAPSVASPDEEAYVSIYEDPNFRESIIFGSASPNSALYSPSNPKLSMARQQEIQIEKAEIAKMQIADAESIAIDAVRTAIHAAKLEDPPSAVPTPEPEELQNRSEVALLPVEMSKIRFKLFYDNRVRGMSVPIDQTFQDVKRKICEKFQAFDVRLEYRDHDQYIIDLEDDDDWESAIDAAREIAAGRAEGKLDIMVHTFKT